MSSALPASPIRGAAQRRSGLLGHDAALRQGSFVPANGLASLSSHASHLSSNRPWDPAAVQRPRATTLCSGARNRTQGSTFGQRDSLSPLSSLGGREVPGTPSTSRSQGIPRFQATRNKDGVSSTGFDLVQSVTSLGQVVWGKGLPPGVLVQVARESWTAAWRVMMSQLAPSSASGSYQRPVSAYRHTITPDAPDFKPERGRYVLYAALSCPWAHRTLVVYNLKGLSSALSLCIARPGESGLWEFSGEGEGPKDAVELPKASLSPPSSSSSSSSSSLSPSPSAAKTARLRPTQDGVNGCQRLKDVYQLQPRGYDGRATVPMLWDTKTKRVVNNESADIIRILNSRFNDWADNPGLDLAPESAATAMEEWDGEIYESVNNGVYCCGFATSQLAYDAAVNRLFSTLDKIDAHLSSSRFLVGDKLSLSDVRLFTTLIRFDVAYHTLFKCSRQKISEYPNLSNYLRDIYQTPGVAETCDVSGVGQSYFGALFPLNPGGIIPAMPRCSLDASLALPHNRDKLRAANLAAQT